MKMVPAGDKPSAGTVLIIKLNRFPSFFVSILQPVSLVDISVGEQDSTYPIMAIVQRSEPSEAATWASGNLA